MKKTRKKFVILCSMIMLLSLVLGCGKSNNKKNGNENIATSNTTSTQDDENESTTAQKKMYTIGVSQFATHDALDAAYKGFVDGLAEKGYKEGENVTFKLQNAQGEQSNCVTIASTLVNSKPDLILAIATPSAEALANETKDIPILVTAVTDPASSGLVESNEAPGGNVTGTSDLNPIKEQLDLLMELAPNTKKLGFLYSSSEPNSEYQIDIADNFAKDLNLKTERYTISALNDIEQVIQSAVGKIDALYIPTDNTLASGMATVAMVANANKIPVICGEAGMVNNGGLATYGLNYYNLGKQTADMAIKILEGKAKPADMPIEYLKKIELVINEATADELGITIPDDLLAKMNE